MLHRLILVSLAALLASCASTPTVKTDFDPAATFSSYKTYSWLSKPTGGSPLAQQRIVDGIDARLKAKGWTLSPSGDVRIAANVTAQEKQDYTTYYSGMGYGMGWRGYGYGAGPGMATTSVYTYEVGTLVVDMFDTSTKRAIWRGHASGVLPDNPDKMAALLQASLDQLFADFPPKPAAAK
ncbi:DUF4136 domain-containing protein [uncultured Ramlibacter sp.]|uniref:DUF4136 domain-containing protein n=1 Tax=uncultured Ramlibacter sp. TaxID=260755 RepID=UPI00260AF3D9|nr:DUF4136 domain-containing protein [uncultured Ramlibacter sp.]